MKSILIMFLLYGCHSYAGTAKITWNHTLTDNLGNSIVLDGFKVYWGANGAPLTNVVPLAMLQPWKSENGMHTFSKTLTLTQWVPGMAVCFQMTAFVPNMESPKSNQACKTFSTDPNAPIIIDID